MKMQDLINYQDLRLSTLKNEKEKLDNETVQLLNDCVDTLSNVINFVENFEFDSARNVALNRKKYLQATDLSSRDHDFYAIDEIKFYNQLLQ